MYEAAEEGIKFEEAWYILNNLVGFGKMPKDHIDVPDKQSKPHSIGGRQHHHSLWVRSKKHQYREARFNIERIFTDYRDEENFHAPAKPRRNPTIAPKARKVCVRCLKPKKKLERDHIIALWKGGKDTEDNLQWLCHVCHRVKTTLDNIEYELSREGRPQWFYDLWNYRLKVANEMNPVGQDFYASYWNDPKTHHKAFYKRPKAIIEVEPSLTLESFA